MVRISSFCTELVHNSEERESPKHFSHSFVLNFYFKNWSLYLKRANET